MTPTKDWGRWAAFRFSHYPHITDEELSTCAVCGRPRPFAPGRIPEPNVRCSHCWEVEHRLADYLRDGGDRAYQFVAATLHASKP